MIIPLHFLLSCIDNSKFVITICLKTVAKISSNFEQIRYNFCFGDFSSDNKLLKTNISAKTLAVSAVVKGVFC